MKKLFKLMFIAFLAPIVLSCNQDANETLEEKDPTYNYKKQEIVYDYDKTKLELRSGSGNWSTVTPIPTPTEGASVAAVGDLIIVALGFSGGDKSWTRIYNPLSDTWSMGSNAPGASSEGVGVAYDGIFYNVGGRGSAFSALWSYDLNNDSWSTLSPMPTPRSGLAAAVVDNNIYAIGGRSGTNGPKSGSALSIVEKYDISTGTWSTVASLPSPRSDLAAVARGHLIFVFGGFDDLDIASGAVDVYDTNTDTWSTAPTDMPTPRGGLYAVGMKGVEVFVIGGWDGITFPGTAGNVVESYNIKKDLWKTAYSPMPTARGEAGVASLGGRIYMVGGATPAFGSPIASMEVFKPKP